MNPEHVLKGFIYHLDKALSITFYGQELQCV